jgi:hypothetical protein
LTNRTQGTGRQIWRRSAKMSTKVLVGMNADDGASLGFYEDGTILIGYYASELNGNIYTEIDATDTRKLYEAMKKFYESEGK